MPISGLVITFSSAVAEHSEALNDLSKFPEIETGVCRGSKLAIVVDSNSKARDQEIWNSVRQLPGVIDVAVAMVAFDEPDKLDSEESSEEGAE